MSTVHFCPLHLCRSLSLCPLHYVPVFTCCPFICRLSTHSLVQFLPHVFSLYGPVVIPCLTLSNYSKTGDMKALWFLWFWNQSLCRAWDSGWPSDSLSLIHASEGKQTRSKELPALDELSSTWSSKGTKEKLIEMITN